MVKIKITAIFTALSILVGILGYQGLAFASTETAKILISGVPENNGMTSADVNYLISFIGCKQKKIEIKKDGYRINDGEAGILNEEGSYSFYVQGVTVGGEIVTYSLNFYIDKTQPRLDIPSELNSLGEITNEPIDLSFSSDKKGVVYLVVNNVVTSKAVNSYETVSFDSISSDGTYNIKCYAKDLAGNQSKNSFEKNVTVKTKGPIIKITGIIEGQKTKEATANITVNEGTFNAYIDKQSNKYNAGAKITESGEHILYVEAYDTLKNKSESSIKFTIDSKAPEFEGILTDSVSPYLPIGLVFDEGIDASSLNDGNLFVINQDTGKKYFFDFTKLRQEKDKETGEAVVYVQTKEILSEESSFVLTINTAEIKDELSNQDASLGIKKLDFKTTKLEEVIQVTDSNVKDKVLANGSITLTFSADLYEEFTNLKGIFITNNTTGANLDYTAKLRANVITIIPKSDFVENTTYTLKLPKEAVKNKDNIPMKADYISEFKLPELLKVVDYSPKDIFSEKRPTMKITFNNKISEADLKDDVITLIENNNSNANDEVKCTTTLSIDGKQLVIIPNEPLLNNGKYKLILNKNIMDIYSHKLSDGKNLEWLYKVETKVAKGKVENVKFEEVSNKVISLSFVDNFSGEDGYIIRIEGEEDISVESIDGVGNEAAFEIKLDNLRSSYETKIIPCLDGEEEEAYSNTTEVKIKMKAPLKMVEVKNAMLKDGSVNWTWKEPITDYEGEESYFLIRKNKLDKPIIVKASNGKFIDAINYDNEKIQNNSIIRYISRGISIEGLPPGKFLESEIIKYTISLPEKPVKPTINSCEYNKSNKTLDIKWTISDSKNTVSKFNIVITDVYKGKEYVIKQNLLSVKGKGQYQLKVKYNSINSSSLYRVTVTSKNSFGVMSDSVAKNLVIVQK